MSLICVMGVNAVLNDSVVYYSFDDSNLSGSNPLDLSGNGNDGTNNGATTGANGIINEAFSFDGTTDYLTAPVNLDSMVFTISWWGNYSAESKVEYVWSVGQEGGSFGRSLCVIESNNDFRCTYGNGASNNNVRETNENLWDNKMTHFVMSVSTTKVTLYIDGNNVSDETFTGNTQDTEPTLYWMVYDDGSSDQNNGVLDEVAIYNRTLTEGEIDELYNSGTGYNPYSGEEGGIVTLISPQNGSATNENIVPINFNTTIENPECTLWGNFSGTWEENTNYLSFFQDRDDNIGFNFTPNPGFGSANWYWNFTIIGDDVIANITTPNDNISINIPSSCLQEKILQIHERESFSSGSLFCYNYSSSSEVEIFTNTPLIGNPGFEGLTWNTTYAVNLTEGDYYWNVECNSTFATENYTFAVDQTNPVLNTNFINDSAFGFAITGQFNFSDENLIDRVNFTIDNQAVFYQENISANTFQYNLSELTSSYPGTNHNLTIIYSDKGESPLNTVIVVYNFFTASVSETFEDPIVSTTQTEYNLTIANSPIVSSALLEWNGTTNLTATRLVLNSTHERMRVLYIPQENITTDVEITHRWWFNVSSGFENTSVQTQTIYFPDIGLCSGLRTYPVINFSYRDEVTMDLITADMSYTLDVTDGTNTFNLTGGFSGQTSDALCTNLNPDNITFNWAYSGRLTLDKDGYATRVYNIDALAPEQMSNNPVTNKELFLISLGNSTTVTYTWRTTDWALIEGTMQVFRCNENGSTSLVESTPIISGKANANIELITQTYSYNVMIGGVTYSNPIGYSLCHAESATELSFFVEVFETTVDELMGQVTTQCVITKIDSNTVQMDWGPNPLDPTNYLTGCVQVYRDSVLGQTLVFEDCSVEAEGYSRQVIIPNSTNNYLVGGVMEFENTRTPCSNTVSFYQTAFSDDVGFGLSGLFGAFMLVASMGLFYAGDGELTVIGSGVGFIFAWALGVMSGINIMAVSFIIFITLLVAFIGRYSRK
jgi:hypothetical protein